MHRRFGIIGQGLIGQIDWKQFCHYIMGATLEEARPSPFMCLLLLRWIRSQWTGFFCTWEITSCKSKLKQKKKTIKLKKESIKKLNSLFQQQQKNENTNHWFKNAHPMLSSLPPSFIFIELSMSDISERPGLFYNCWTILWIVRKV